MAGHELANIMVITPQNRFAPGELRRRLAAARLAHDDRALRRLIRDLNGVPRGAPLVEVSRGSGSASSSGACPCPAAGPGTPGSTPATPT